MSGRGTDPSSLAAAAAQLFSDVLAESERWLARKACISPTTLGNLLRGSEQPKWETVRIFVNTCGVVAADKGLTDKLPADTFELSRWRPLYDKAIAERRGRDPRSVDTAVSAAAPARVAPHRSRPAAASPTSSTRIGTTTGEINASDVTGHIERAWKELIGRERGTVTAWQLAAVLERLDLPERADRVIQSLPGTRETIKACIAVCAVAGVGSDRGAQMLDGAESAARSEPDPRERIWRTQDVVDGCAANGWLDRGEALALALPDGSVRDFALRSMASAYIRAGHLPRATRMCEEFDRFGAFSQVELCEALARDGQVELACEKARRTNPRSARVWALIRIASILHDADHARAGPVLAEAEEVALGMRDPRDRCTAFKHLLMAADHASPDQVAAWFAEYLPLASAEDGFGIEVVDLVEAHLRHRQVADAVAVAGRIGSDWPRSRALTAIAKHLATHGRPGEAEAMAALPPNARLRAESLIAIVTATAATDPTRAQSVAGTAIDAVLTCADELIEKSPEQLTELFAGLVRLGEIERARRFATSAPAAQRPALLALLASELVDIDPTTALELATAAEHAAGAVVDRPTRFGLLGAMLATVAAHQTAEPTTAALSDALIALATDASDAKQLAATLPAFGGAVGRTDTDALYEICDALYTSAQTVPSDDRFGPSTVLQACTQALCGAGLPELAHDLAATELSPWQRSRILSDVASYLRGGNQIESAVVVARDITEPYFRAEELARLAVHCANRDDPRGTALAVEAAEVARRTEEGWRDGALVVSVHGLLATGQYDAALTQLDLIDKDEKRAVAMWCHAGYATTTAESRRLDHAARHLIGRMDAVDMKGHVLIEAANEVAVIDPRLSAALARSALRLAQESDFALLSNSVSWEAVRALARAGQHAEARRYAESIFDPKTRSFALSSIAEAQAAASDWTGSEHSVAAMPDVTVRATTTRTLLGTLAAAAAADGWEPDLHSIAVRLLSLELSGPTPFAVLPLIDDVLPGLGVNAVEALLPNLRPYLDSVLGLE